MGSYIRFSIDLKDDVTKEQTSDFEKSVRSKVEKLDDQMQVALSPVGIVGTSRISVNGRGRQCQRFRDGRKDDYR